ncbi:hypothetical protein CDD83_1434 [Cordyceps sp. RAO-2017]|nr:hypothetical protein CDD83_1434 [Cordyceps sp. RAO-2017]
MEQRRPSASICQLPQPPPLLFSPLRVQGHDAFQLCPAGPRPRPRPPLPLLSAEDQPGPLTRSGQAENDMAELKRKEAPFPSGFSFPNPPPPVLPLHLASPDRHIVDSGSRPNHLPISLVLEPRPRPPLLSSVVVIVVVVVVVVVNMIIAPRATGPHMPLPS